VMAQDKREPTQKTDKGLEIPIPKRKDFERLVKKVARPTSRKGPGGTHRPRGRSGS
jgi:hypothetical protein